MFANVLRSQARLGRMSTALSARHTLSGLAGTRVAVAAPSSLARLVVSPRAFTQSAPVFNDNQEPLQESDTDTIFVGNLPWSATRDEIKGLFSEFGQVVDVRIRELPITCLENLRDTHFFMLVETHADGRPRGFANVTFENVKHSVAAVLSATEKPIHIGGRDLVVNYARPKAIPRHNNEPNEKIYFSGFAEGEDALRELMKDVEDDIVSIQFGA